MMYAAPNRRTTHRLARLDVPTPSWMRAPGETPGHVRARVGAWTSWRSRCGIDPIELRIRNEPEVDPESGPPLLQPQPGRLPARGRRALRLGRRDPRPRRRRDGRWLVGTGVAASTYPARRRPSSARGRVEPDGRLRGPDRRRRHRHRRPHGADARSPPTRSEVAVEQRPASQIGDIELSRGVRWPAARWATRLLGLGGRSRPAASCASPDGRARREVPLTVEADTTTRSPRQRPSRSARHAFGAQFVEVRVDADTGEVRVAAAARRVRRRPDHQPQDGPLAVHRRDDHGDRHGAARGERRSTCEFGDYVNHDLAGYHVADERRHRGHRGGLARRGRPARQPDGRQGHRRDRDRRHRRGDRQRRPPRHRHARARPADPAGQADRRAARRNR